MVEKYYNDAGQVAILYSPGYGAGWSTWNQFCREGLIFDKRLVQLILDDKRGEITEELLDEFGYPECYASTEQLQIEWLDPGTQFIINEYDGSESIQVAPDFLWNVA
jgi:hypothetical protein